MVSSRSERSLVLDVDSLRLFRELVAEGGFTAASKKLGIAQPSASRRLRRLEERIGMSLISRQGYSFTLTERGRDLLAHAEKIVEAHDRAVDHMRRSEIRGVLRLGCSGAIAPQQLSWVASRFRQTHPVIDLTIRVGESWIISDMLDTSKIDVAILHLVEANSMRATDVVWQRDDLYIVQGLDVDFAEDPIPLISFGPRSLLNTHLITALQTAGRAHRIAVEWPNVLGVKSAIEAGLGVGILNTLHVTEAMRPWRGIDQLDLPRSVFVVRSRPQAQENAPIDALRDLLLEAFTQRP